MVDVERGRLAEQGGDLLGECRVQVGQILARLEAAIGAVPAGA